MHLYIANKLYSSWSMRPWLVLKAFDIPFQETVIPLRQPDTKASILEHSPTGKVPVLVDGDALVWESLAIILYLAERFPEKPIWPAGVAARAHALSVATEMHAGFQTLRQACPMNLGKRYAAPAMTDDLRANIERIEEMWRTTRARFSDGSGPFLFGPFTAADAMFAPVVTRLESYSLPVSAGTRAYMDAVQSFPAFRAWKEAAFHEPWRIADYEAGHTVTEDFLRSEA